MGQRHRVLQTLPWEARHIGKKIATTGSAGLVPNQSSRSYTEGEVGEDGDRQEKLLQVGSGKDGSQRIWMFLVVIQG